MKANESPILFGSYAERNPTAASDIDIIIDSKGKIRGIRFEIYKNKQPHTVA